MDAMELKYMKRVRSSLRLVGAWPDHMFRDNPEVKLSAIQKFGYSLLLFAICCVAIVAQLMYLINNFAVLDFIDIGDSFVPFFVSWAYLERTTLPMIRPYQSLIHEFVSKFHLIHHKNKSEFSNKMYNKVNRFCKIATTVQHIQLVTSSCMFNIAPLVYNYSAGMLSLDRPANVTFKHSVNYALPFDQNNGVVYIGTLIFNWFVSLNLAVLLCCHDLQTSVLVFHIWGHLSIIKHNLNYFQRPSIPQNAKEVPLRYSSEERKNVNHCLKEIIQHYIMTKKFVSKTSEAYNVSLCVYYGFHLVTDCVILLACSSLNPAALARLLLLALVLFQQLIQLSVVFELVSSKGDTIPDAVYSLPWEYMDADSRRTVLILLQIAQQSLAVKACGMVPVGVQTMLAVLKTSCSYFLMLKTFASE